MQGRVLIVAGSDSGGGAGIQADIKTITALGAYASTAITALTAQNTLGVHGVHPVPPEFIRQQMKVVLDDIGADCIKTGMLHSPEIIETVAALIGEQAKQTPLVVDPVMFAKGGDRLIDSSAMQALKETLLPLAAIITPNLKEAEALTGTDVEDVDEMKQAADSLLKLGAKAVLIKGGHAKGDTIFNVLRSEDGFDIFESPRINTRNLHGTGCTLASAIAAGLAEDFVVQDAVARACQFVHDAIANAPNLGSGHGPLNHSITIRGFEDRYGEEE